MNSQPPSKARSLALEISVVATAGVIPSLTLLFGDNNGLGYFQQSQGHQLFYAVATADLLNMTYFFLIALCLLPWIINAKRYVIGALAVLAASALLIVTKALADVALAHIWYPDLIDLPFIAHLKENSYFAPGGLLLAVAYGIVRRLLLQRPGEAINDAQTHLEVMSGNHLHRFPLSEITIIKAEGNYVQIHAGPRKELVYTSMSKLIDQLPPDRFVRTHRSYIVNLDHLEKHAEKSVQIAGEMVPVSRAGKEPLALALNGSGI